MQDVQLANAGVVLISVIYILRLVFTFVSNGPNGIPKWAMRIKDDVQEMKVIRETIKSEIHDLHVWHRPDTNGEMTWKNSRMIDCVETLTQVVDRQTRVMERLMPVLERLESKL